MTFAHASLFSMIKAVSCFSIIISFLLCVDAGAASEPVRVNIGVASVSSSALSLWVAKEQGTFAKHGVDAELILIRADLLWSRVY